MTLRHYLLALAFGATAAVVAALIVLLGIDPVTAGTFAFGTLYVTLGAACAGILTIIGTLVRVRKHTHVDVGDAVARSLRQGVFLSVLVLVTLYISAHGYLTIWTALLLVIFVTLIEFFFLIAKKG